MANKRLMEPIKIGSITTRNRIVKPAAGTGLQTPGDGNTNQRTIDFYETIARGGAGLLIVQSALMDYALAAGTGVGYRLDDDKYIDSYKRLTDVVHAQGCPVFMQTLHAGQLHRSSLDGLPPVSASSMTKQEMPRPQYEEPRGLTVDEIKDLVGKFGDMADRVKRAGFDGIEVNASHNHLLNAFLSRAYNKRQDDYGGSPENRARFIVEIIREIKNRVGQDFPVIALINGAEYQLKDGITSAESQAYARLFQDAGADAIHVRGEIYLWDEDKNEYFESVHFPELANYPDSANVPALDFDNSHHGIGGFVPLAANIKKVVSIPVIAVGDINAQLGEAAIREGRVDLISLNRRLLADPEYPKKVAEGRLEDIAPCTSCFHCFNTVIQRKPMECRVNASLGKEREYAIEPVKAPKKVLVIGGGPAGLEAARVAAQRGHDVTLIERAAKLGGLMPMAAMIKGTEIEDLPGLVRYLKTQITKLGVAIRLGQPVDAAVIEQIKPDVVLLAAGGKYTVPDIPGIGKPIVVSGKDLSRKLASFLKFFRPGMLRWLTRFWMPLGKRVVIIGGGIQGCEMAEFLIKRGRQVTIVEEGENLGEGLYDVIVKRALLSWLKDKGVTMLTGVRLEEITDSGLVITDKDGQRREIRADSVATALPLQPNDELLKQLQQSVKDIRAVGDCRQPNLIAHAIADGSRIARQI